MESFPTFSSSSPAHDNDCLKEEEERGRISQVDRFLVEILENPRHRLTVLRMELEILRFMHSDENQFEFQHFPTSYLRCAAHRVAQHYGLQTMIVDSTADGIGSRIVARRTPESRFPQILLSDIPTKQFKNEKAEQIKIFVRSRPSKASLCDDGLEPGNKGLLRTVEERKEEYDKARARIFSSSFAPDAVATGRNALSIKDEKETGWNTKEEAEKIITKDTISRVAIFRDRDKDRVDPDYDRSYDRYALGFPPCLNFAMGASNVLQPPHVRYDGGFSQLAFRPSEGPTQSTFGAVGCSQTCPGAVYLQWSAPAMVYAPMSMPGMQYVRLQVTSNLGIGS